jgi:hypothetical protein
MTSLSHALRQELARLVDPLASAAESEHGWTLLLQLVGHTAETAERPELRTALQGLSGVAAQVEQLDDASLTSWEGLQRVLDTGSAAMTALRELEAGVGDAALATLLEDLGLELTEQLVALYLRRYHPRLFRAAAVLTLVEPSDRSDPEPAVVDGDAFVRSAWARDRLRLDRLQPLLQDPWTTLGAEYFPHGLAAAADAHACAARLFPLLGAALGAAGLSWLTDVRSLVPDPPRQPPSDADLGDHLSQPPPPPEDWPPPDLTAYYVSTQPRLVVIVPQASTETSAGAARLALEVLASSTQHPGAVAGLIVGLLGSLKWTEQRGSWRITVTSEGEVPAFVVGPSGFALAPTTSPVLGASAQLEVERIAATAGGPAFVFGSDTGTRVEARSLKLNGSLELAPAEQSLALTVAASSAKLVIAPGDGDGFLQSVLPSEGLSIDFDLGITVSSARGIEIAGGAGLEAALPVHLSLGPLGSIDAILIDLVARDDGIRGHAACALTLRLGPVGMSLDRIGLEATMTFPQAGGNLGVANLELGFAEPTGLGLSVDAGPVSGGGFLFYDPVQEQYAGALQLEFSGIALKAVGILTTRLPGGVSGFSLLVIVSAEFTPVQLGLGFTLNGVGGLLGVNRVAAVEPLRAGLRSEALGAILFPSDPVGHAQELVATISTVFPPALGRYVFGPTARIGWGTPTLVTIDIALVLELPAPVRLIILGRLRALLPDEQAQVVRLQMDVLGVVDFDRREAAADAVLVDSRIASFTLTGAMAMRLCWGPDSTFLLAVGGFHPRFLPPPGFPRLERVAVALASGDNPRLRLDAYLAVTSNTLQFGARLDLSVRAGGFGVAGFLSFDALLQQEPLSFLVDIAGSLAVTADGHTLLSVTLKLTLSGPQPWHAKGRASFSILFFDVSVGFEITIGDQGPPALPPPIEVAPILLAALNDPRSWSAQLPTGGDALVTLRGLPATTEILAHPHGTLQVRQRQVPLDQPLERFGGDVPAGPNLFRIGTATLAGGPAQTQPLEDLFAPAQYQNLTDDQKLNQPSFTPMHSGAQIGQHDLTTGTPLPVELSYEKVTIPAAA